MLVFMSDLHFVDGSAGEHNVKTSAFELVFQRVADRAEKTRAESVDIVLLGDTVDLLRTEYWFETRMRESEKPWAVDAVSTPRLIDHIAEISKRIVSRNANTFSLFRNIRDVIRDAQKEMVTEKVTVTYIPGNHDRLLSLDDGRLMNPLLAELGATLPRNSIRYIYDNPECQVVARHGHEFDGWNFEDAETINIDKATASDYMRCPIGDPITTELITRLPYLAAKTLKNAPDVEVIKKRLQEIDNVRPLASVLKWLFFQFKDDRESVREAVEAAIDRAAEDFRALPYVKQWIEKHDRFLRADKADALQAVLAIADHLQITKAESLFKAVDIGGRLKSSDPLETAAETALLKCAKTGDARMFLIMGHTHKPKQIAVNVTALGHRQLEQIYLNTGTFRTRHHEARRRGFVTWKQLTYVILYSEQEMTHMDGEGDGGPGFESWTGARK